MGQARLLLAGENSPNFYGQKHKSFRTYKISQCILPRVEKALADTYTVKKFRIQPIRLDSHLS